MIASLTPVSTTDRPVSEYERWLLEQSWTAPYPTTGITFTDFFCGFGGSSIGLTEAGLELVWAANHWDLAIENHAANFRHADHYQGDISGYDMRRVPKSDVAWISPECTWHSPAGGRKRVRAELDALFPDEHVSSDAGERSRATMWDVVRAAEAKAFKIIIVENVVEVTSWPLFDGWLDQMETLGYKYQIVCVSAAHVGDEVNPHAPQWRDRIYIVFYKKQIAFPVIEPRPLAWCPQCDGVVESRQSWKKKDQKHDLGKYGPQYVYVCASNNHPSLAVEPYVLPATAAIDWSDLGTVIEERDRELAGATMRRIETGVRMFARPVTVQAAGNTYDSASSGKPGSYVRVQPVDRAPLGARTTTDGDGLAVPPFVTNVRHGEGDTGRQYLPDELPLNTAQTKIGDAMVMPVGGTWRTQAQVAADGPLPTRTTADDLGIVAPPMMVAGYDYSGGDERRVKPVGDAPLHTVVANGRGHHQLVVPPFVTMLRANGRPTLTDGDALAALTTARHHGLTVPDGAFLSRQYTSRGSNDDHLNSSVDEPLHPITASGGNHALVIPYRRGSKAYPPGSRPLHTMSTVESGGLLQFDFTDAEIKEIVAKSRFRMLGPLEHGRAQRFPDSYAVKGNKGDQTKGFGNAVASNVAHWLGRFCVRALAGYVSREERAA